MTWPIQLAINAYTRKGPVIGEISPKSRAWASWAPAAYFQLKPDHLDKADWSDSHVGWGLVLPEREGLSENELALATDAPEPIQVVLEARRRLLRERGGDAQIFRYCPTSPNKYSHLRNYASQVDKVIDAGAERGAGPKELPYYLLIYGTPEEIPWELQYNLNAVCFVGRLDLQGMALENYVNALLGGWKDATAQPDHAVVWAVDHATNDITTLMRNAIAEKIYSKLNADEDLKVLFLDGKVNQAKSGALISALREHKPALVVTTSHGLIEPLTDPIAMRDTLGLLVDQDFMTLQPARLLEQWSPDGAIWYAHACCSAGGDKRTMYNGLVEPDSDIGQVLKAVASAGAITSPLPRALLGASRPLRAFIGQVNPTFDWSIRNPTTGEFLTGNLTRSLYNELYLSQPVGFAFNGCYQSLATLYSRHSTAARHYMWEEMLYCKLSILDRQSMVILGDPIVTLPPLPQH